MKEHQGYMIIGLLCLILSKLCESFFAQNFFGALGLVSVIVAVVGIYAEKK